MNRVLNDHNQLEKDFIDLAYIQLKTYEQCTQILNIDLPEIQRLNRELDAVWRPITAIRNVWKRKNIGGSFWDFYYWYTTAEECCHYCGISKEELHRLHEIGIKNKRTTRGRSLEIDRKVADEKYENIGNLTYCCYWCNNAKTDTFSEEEFKIIGQAISQVWKKRLNDGNR